MNLGIVQEYQSGSSITALALRYHMSWLTIRHLLLDANVPLRTLREAQRLCRRCSAPMSTELQERVKGELLGDGRIVVGKHLSYFVFASKHREYAEWLLSWFKQERVPIGKGGVCRVEQYDARTMKTYTRYTFRTKSTEEFHSIGVTWYVNGVKRAPPDLLLSKLSVLHWWLGDGSIGNGCGHFCTDCFTADVVSKLSLLLNELFGIDSRVVQRKNPNGEIVHRIYMRKTSLTKMLDEIGHSPIACLAYRWMPRRFS